RELGEVRLDLRPYADRAREHVSLRMLARRVSADLATPQQLADERVVVGELADALAAHEVGAAVADVRERGAALLREQRHQRGAYAGQLALLARGLVHLAVRGDHRVAELLREARLRAFERSHGAQRRFRGQLARDLSRHVAA